MGRIGCGNEPLSAIRERLRKAAGASFLPTSRCPLYTRPYIGTTLLAFGVGARAVVGAVPR